MKRKFNSQRLYKLTRFLVVLISIISALLSIWVDNIYLNWTNQLQSILKETCHASSVPPSYQLTCANNILKNYNDIALWRANFILIAIFTPILFYMIVFIYRYIFPKRNSEPKSSRPA